MTDRRPEIQALRALAVALVVAFHVWPDAVPGGFVGVDVFFVISGFLITGGLVREARAGRLRLGAFWARRARRLLPAALLVLGVCTAATIAFLPRTAWEGTLTEVGASALYLQNWQLAHDAVDYLAAAEAPSLVQHFWSLSVEEQFYLAWPLLVLGAAAVRRPWALPAVLGLVTAASLAWSALRTSGDPAAYFQTPARAWEFGAGGLLALAGARAPRRRGVAAALQLAGLAAIGLAAGLYGAGTTFPGLAALLPVAGALAVIAAGAPLRVLAVAPLQRLGDLSYATYLWHWPLLLLVPHTVGGEGTLPVQVGVVGATLALAALTAWAVEDPIRHAPPLRRAPAGPTLAAAAAATALLVVPLAVARSDLRADARAEQARAERLATAGPACFGAATRDPRRPCENPQLSRIVAPSPLAARLEPNAPCRDVRREGTITACHFGVAEDEARATVALVGDSHAAHWRPALERVALQEGWHGISLTRTSCPFSFAEKVIPGRDAQARCRAWTQELPRWLAARPEVGTVFVGASATGEVLAGRGTSQREAKVEGYRAAWRSLPPSIGRLIVLRDTPRVTAEVGACVEDAVERGAARVGEACAVPRTAAVRPDPQVLAADGFRRVPLLLGRTRFARVAVLDLNEAVCDRRRCLPVVGGALVFKDGHHMTRAFATTLGPLLARAAAGVLPIRKD
jgi:peptidoglycan/LPS O-acetylase OafA/YrhL